MQACEKFRKIPGVLRVATGEVVLSDRPIVEDSYDVGLLVVVDLGRSRGFAYNIFLDICKFIPNFIEYTTVFISTNCRFVGHDSN